MVVHSPAGAHNPASARAEERSRVASDHLHQIGVTPGELRQDQ